MLLFAGVTGQYFQQIDTASQVLPVSAHPKQQATPGLHGDKLKEVGGHGDSAAVVIIAQSAVLCGDTGCTVIQVTNTQVFTTQATIGPVPKPALGAGAL